jgi:hypothetical protein
VENVVEEKKSLGIIGYMSAQLVLSLRQASEVRL